MRRCGHEPAARGSCARLRRRLGDWLARLFGDASGAPSAARASGSPASSSSGSPRETSRSAPGAACDGLEALAAAGDFEHFRLKLMRSAVL